MSQDVAGRLDIAIQRAGTTQAEVARKVQRPLQTVNDWVSKGRIPQDVLLQVADALKADVKWLLTGEGRGPRAASEEERKAYRTQVGWGWVENDPDGNEDHGNSNAYTVPADLDTFVRETGQNIIDAALAGPAEAVFRIVSLTGEDRGKFEETLGWKDLSEHLDAAARMEGKFNRRLRDGIQAVSTSPRLVILRVEDRNTQGLTGAERRQEGTVGNFIRFCRGNLMSNKSAGSGGSYGLGKAVNWRCSHVSTVLVNSRLSEPIDDGRFDNRVFGRADLAFHVLDDEEER